ncbi:hypothetical protein MPTK1_7g04440 [Marchantia polymorpha subsp. ruderalis]|nr:hypothetical protein MARPO_0062s0081 [Marchantia polymorpha]PTQ36665.1 hypothetical protein MARPO_0062s0081 [Marchantia polymorpha]BBN16216.1 hypothetical protein Mp_7g04440 [Marchantia polymorpha subsp. ruderalis]BBN16217.1 hypothetical protein Mp_7g04440 [Marchantia polymorpha subsp. ruderalis]|eukprot:PTQ36664.1 hypothetical protein MARPO_0062s0081 [Marchantia polymorpha]
MASWDTVNQLFREIAQLKKETELALTEIEELEIWLENVSPETLESDIEGKMARHETLYSEERDRATKEETLLNQSILQIDAIAKQSENGQEDDTQDKDPSA